MFEIDFIIVTRNQLEYTKRCLDSILKNIFQNSKLIIVDNNSDIMTLDYLRKLSRQLHAAKKIEIIENDRNLGYAHALNQGLASSHSAYVFLCNNDIEFYPNAVTEMISVASAQEMIGLVNPNSNEFGLKKYDGEQLKRWQGTWIERCHTSGFCVLVKRKVLDQIKGIDLDFSPAYYEDMDFAERAKQHGFLCVVARGAYVHHFGTKTFLPKEKQAAWDKNKALFIKKWGGTKWFAFLGSDALVNDEVLRKSVIQHLLQVARSHIAIIHIFIPPAALESFQNIHDSFRVQVVPAWAAEWFLLFKTWRGRKKKPISHILTDTPQMQLKLRRMKKLVQTPVEILEEFVSASSYKAKSV
ncbi:MAG: hypothetical protein COV74_09205 [Candidatus Omnitrophica bacterium CG11_big_fil_rev_8_21_14_0_20_45_26]|uniref:Glycosyltransferase 2-like domain-containing protein n=1 Tax=Candidatus Abzuiibacterium crystallinum TaxID=1974748 RepID=A0A2H0LLX1_9BACT|nr:MAG: hypothetical protein COV74_09205 [Candidatus Omnitrophica bacterium CG11_big_fil_rev_8_21_14_0_20_45_26]PIW63248.1 MAG: hypothetical protein COW12_11180 [Candidatus Omnitrophica bacterium CG12_big_fil_rev_8_21_14_0_65_45_16]